MYNIYIVIFGGVIIKKLISVNGNIDWGALIISIIIAEGIGYLSAAFSMTSPSYYKELARPSFAPPAWIFGPVWIILYLLMAIAAYRVWMYRNTKKGVYRALFYYFLQLLLNFLWSIIFFRYRLIAIAFFEIIILLIFIIITTVKFFKIDKISGLLMIPYILWVSFASILNYSLWILNS